MADLKIDVAAAVESEYERASKKFGTENNSSHESYAVILEEYEEAKEAPKEFDKRLKDFWASVKGEEGTLFTIRGVMLEDMKNIAENTAAEWIQVAAMCHKALITEEGPEER